MNKTRNVGTGAKNGNWSLLEYDISERMAALKYCKESVSSVGSIKVYIPSLLNDGCTIRQLIEEQHSNIDPFSFNYRSVFFSVSNRSKLNYR